MPKCGRRSDPSFLATARTSRDFTQLLAPFGNTFTPTARMKIVAGKPFYVSESGNSNPVRRQQWQTLKPITDKPNNIDPRHFALPQIEGRGNSAVDAEPPSSNYSYKTVDQDHFQSHVHRSSPTPNVKRYAVVPPIHALHSPQPGKQLSNQQTEAYSVHDHSTQTDTVPIQKEYNKLPQNQQNQPRYFSEHKEPYATNNYYEPHYNDNAGTDNSPVQNGQRSPTPIERETRDSFQTRSQQNSYVRAPYSLHEPLSNNAFQYNDKKTHPNTHLDHAHLNSSRISNTKEYLIQKYLPVSEYLPRDAINLSSDDNHQLMQIAKKELISFHVDKLKDIYLDLANIDRQLSGRCSVKDLSFVLGKNKVLMAPEIMRLIAANCVSALYERNIVNYEKFLSLLANVLDSDANTSKPTHGSIGPDQKSSLPGSTSPDRDTVDLLRAVEDQLACLDQVIDIEDLRQQLQMEDRHHRGTLSFHQIVDACHKTGIFLNETLVDRILARCDQQFGGQYRWMQFVSFLERVQPLRTGLYIPRAKRPLEYARRYRTPTENWPKFREPSSSPRKASPSRQRPSPPLRMPSPSTQKRTEAPRDTDSLRELSSPVEDKQDPISSLERRLDDMQHAYDHLKYQIEKPNDPQEPWFQRYLKMANAVYAQDVTNSGQLSYDQLKEVVTLYNKAYELRIPEMKIEQAIMDNYQRGYVNIHSFLTKLGIYGDK